MTTPPLITGISHIAIGVRNMEASLAFYRDVLGLSLDLDRTEVSEGLRPKNRRACYLRWTSRAGSAYVVLDQHLNRDPFGQPAELFQVGVHHFSFLTHDIAKVIERARSANVELLRPEPALRDGPANGEPDGDHAVLTVMMRDPDGNVIQFDQWLR